MQQTAAPQGRDREADAPKHEPVQQDLEFLERRVTGVALLNAVSGDGREDLSVLHEISL